MQQTTYTKLPQIFYSYVRPMAIEPKTIIWNEQLAKQLNIAPQNFFNPATETIAQSYMGHQFGHLTMLGDGRAILLGEAEGQDVQLKGSGRTPYSRGGDGQAGLGPMLREYIISEAMHGLGIPTTRSLAVLATGREVVRDTIQQGAAVVRTAASHIRVGTFQFARHYGELADVQALADYVIKRHYPQATSYLEFFNAVMTAQAKLVAQWQGVGFVHGVMNTDNTSIAGETIDYGPCAFLDVYQHDAVFSSIDTNGRYSYHNQPQIIGWNLARFVECLLPLFAEDEQQALALAQQAINAYGPTYEAAWLDVFRAKIGLPQADAAFIQALLNIMEAEQRDFTETFRALTLQDTSLCTTERMTQWYKAWASQVTEESLVKMKQANPAFIARNYLVERAITDMELMGDDTSLQQLLTQLKNPYAYSAEQLAYKLPDDERGRGFVTYCGT